MITALLASGIAILVYRAIILPFELEHAIDQFDKETAAPPQPAQLISPPDNNLVELLIAHQAETQRELLTLVSTLAISTAGAEKAAKFAARTAADVARAEEAAEPEPDLEGFPDFGDRNDFEQRQSYLAEALSQIETPDGGRLVDP